MAGTTTQESFLERANISGLDHRIRSRTGPNNIFVATTNSHSNVPVHQQNYFPTDMILDPQLMGLDMGIIDANFNFMLPVTTEQQANSSELAHSIENSQYLGIPMDSSQDESSVTPDVICSSQSNSTPETVPDVDDTEEGAQEEEESLFVTDQDEITVHYGMLHNVEVKLVPDDMSSFDDRLKTGDSPYQYFKPTEYQKQVMLCFPEDEKHFGHLSSAAGQTLMPLITRPRVEVAPLALKIDLREIIHRANKSADARVKVDINIYGPRSVGTSIGEVLSNGKLWLQRSSHSKNGTEYDNPHFLSITVADGHNGLVQNEVVASNGPTKKKTREEQLRKMVEEVYNAVDNTRELELVEGGDRVTRQLLSRRLGRAHLQTGLKIVKYHGDRRPKDLSELNMVEDSDIVVTTYHTLTTEYLIGKGKTSPLYKLGWYRVVLDEETPFGNSYDDLTLVKDRLVMLLEALCLRRTREVLDLPKTRQFVRHLNFTKPERDQYERTRNIIMRNMEHRMGEVEKSSQFGMFQMWLQLRIVCNHGTYQKLFSWHRRNLLEEREAIVGTAGQYGEMLCVGCEQPMPVLGHDWSKKMFEDGCSHVLCTKCIEDSQFSELEISQRRCPVCVRWYQAPSPAGDEEDGTSRRKRKRNATTKDDHEHYFNAEGHSTKIRALVEDVRKDLWTTKRSVRDIKQQQEYKKQIAALGFEEEMD
ncbi:hypothetical protein FGSG_10471 [Fusarium graminearum PH-1]|uniref:hypothetical protein n=1 Tax=Gibberella zeae (strain ATCC MYA-4620 / CBS 123657 / FGSC 9075 / NRRL 31084 / PH-1) TaxID=229533 RepID=UPI00021F23BA|nr:hypothetical protein FGSG_10471 [Fusarium graminearum PH-1]ESU17188.1 hypothetical protein FGSG_10471 [Fusarium graminearum PH-1]|eukprot:XP_011319450.1 hypothetical protein FGSG_10471 [Fusarium graminearum PH-1]